MVAGLLLPATRLAAQRAADPDPRGTLLLARAESLQREQLRLDSAQREQSSQRLRGQIIRSGRLVAVFNRTTSPEFDARVLTRVDSILAAFGGRISSWRDSVVGVQYAVSDSAGILAAPDLRRRTPVTLNWTSGDSSGQSEALSDASLIERRFLASLSSSWKTWLGGDIGVVWTPRWEGERALGALVQPLNTTGSGCLAGSISDCRLWLALDPADRPLAMRYRAADLRAAVRRYRDYNPGKGRDYDSCLAGDDAACVRYAETGVGLLSEIPSPTVARTSFVRAVWARHGVAAIDRALQDTAGGIGARFAAAAGISEDSLVAEWRAWVLARGRPEPLAATLPQSLAVMFAALVLVFLAARSGRWR